MTKLKLFHGGVRCPRRLTGAQPTVPSVVTLKFSDFEVPRALDDAEIKSIIANFVSAAIRAHKAGLTGVEVHAANGYLFTQFMSRATNLRTDRWGGSLVNRARALTATVGHLRAALPAIEVIGWLAKLGGGLHISRIHGLAPKLRSSSLGRHGGGIINARIRP